MAKPIVEKVDGVMDSAPAFDAAVLAADKVLIGGNWYALVNGTLLSGPINVDGGLDLDDPVEVDFFSIDADAKAIAKRAEAALEVLAC